MKRVLTIVTGLWLLGLCLLSAIRAQALLRQERAADVPRALSAASRHTLALPRTAPVWLSALR